ncbi:hypothetical protein JCM1840_007095 [Sporobolomyces johnsonii]
MSFSPRARPHTVNLSFTDPDVTDTYRDDRTTSSCSSPRHRHARGDTPLSRRQGTISGDESNTKGSVTPAQDHSDVDAASERSFNSSSARTYHPSSQASPLFALGSSSTSSISFPSTNHHRTSSSTRYSYEDVDATYTQQHHQQPQHPAPSRSEQDINTQLVAELRDAQDYIAYLQDELRAIRDVVVQLREVPEALPLPNGLALHSAPPSKPHPPSSQPTPTAAAELTNASQEAFEVVKHLIALLPSLSLSPSSQPSPSSQSHPSAAAPPSLHSLSLALRFTRSLDALVHHGQERRDEDVFEEGNLGSVERRVRGWERAVREGGGRAGEGATEDARG